MEKCGGEISKIPYRQKYVALLFTFFVLFIPIFAAAQFTPGSFLFGTDVGGTLLTPSARSNPVSTQYRLFLRHNIHRTISGELNAGLGFLARPVEQSRLFPLEYRLQYSMSDFFSDPIFFGNRLSTYVYAGLGGIHYQQLDVKVQDDPMLRESDQSIKNTSLWRNGSGWSLQIPLGVGIDYTLDPTTSLRMTAGYHLLPDQSVLAGISDWSGFLGVTIGLSFKPPSQPVRKVRTFSRNPVIQKLPDAYGSHKKIQALEAPLLPPAYDILSYRSFPPITYKTLHYEWNNPDEENIQELADILLVNQELKVKVLGYADKRGNEVMNRSLSNARSWQVAKFLLQQGVTYDRIYEKGYGEKHVMDRKNEAPAYAANRRTEVILQYKLPAKDEYLHPEDLLPIEGLENNFHPQVPLHIDFDMYSDELSKEAVRRLQVLVYFLEENEGYVVQVDGPSDNSDKLTMAQMLAEARAGSVTRFLLLSGVDSKRLIELEDPDSKQISTDGDRVIRVITLNKNK